MVNKNPFYWLNKKSRTFLKRGYLDKDQTAEHRIQQIADYAESILKIDGFSDKFVDYMSKGWYSLSTPIWVNFGNKKGLPISCFNSYIPDTMHGILGQAAEVGMMTKSAGGTSGYFGDIRPRGSTISTGDYTTNGSVHFMQLYECTTNIVSQGATRRGSFAAYLPIEHPDLLELLKIRDAGNPIQQMHFAVTVTDEFMNDMLFGLDGQGGNSEKRELWNKVIESRCAKGEPYIFFHDTVNNNAPQVYKDKGMVINASNLCSEICLYSGEDESFVCDLSSMNLLHFEEWKDTDAVKVLCYFLDAVMTDFINKVQDIPFMRKAYNFAVRQRALGLGVLGWHSLLQSRMIPFESMEAKMLNVQIFKNLKEKTDEATQEMAKIFGEPELLKGYGRHNVTMIAIAPTTSSSFILGQVSQGIEPYDSNIFTQGRAKGDFTLTNPYLKQVLKDHQRHTDEIWESILIHGGSVQHLDFLTDNERDVFKTFGEISQKEIVIQAAQRQKYIDQSQSLNLLIPPDVKPKEVSDLIIFGWHMGVKTFYYQRSSNPSQMLSRSIMQCKSCEG